MSLELLLPLDFFLGQLRRGKLKLPDKAKVNFYLLFVVYFWNLDQKLLGWAYVQVNKIFDRKKVDIKF